MGLVPRPCSCTTELLPHTPRATELEECVLWLRSLQLEGEPQGQGGWGQLLWLHQQLVFWGHLALGPNAHPRLAWPGG